MIDIDYEIDEKFQCCTDVIIIGGLGYDKLKENNRDEFICDCITHEFIHVLLEDMFNATVSMLFDFIGDSLLNKDLIRKGVCLVSNDELWSDMILKEGPKHLFNEYMIDNIRLIQAYLICNARGV